MRSFREVASSGRSRAQMLLVSSWAVSSPSSVGQWSAALTLDRYADLFDNDLDAVADRLDDVARDARGHLAD